MRFECPDDDAKFSTHKVDEIQISQSITLYFEDDNLDEWVTQLQEKGIVFNQLPEDNPIYEEKLVYKTMIIITSSYIM